MNDTTRKILQDNISQLIGQPFTVTQYITDPTDDSKFEVSGTIMRHGETVNIKASAEKNEFRPQYWSIADESIALLPTQIGTIRLGKDVIVSDPCYNRDVWCMTKLGNVKPGIWVVSVCIDTLDSWGKRCYVLELRHRSVKNRARLAWDRHGELGVDSGTMSIFDDAHYRRKNGSVEEFEADLKAKDSFTDKCFHLTDEYAGIYNANNKGVGVVCSSGIGDGEYPLYTVEKEGEIIAMEIRFL